MGDTLSTRAGCLREAARSPASLSCFRQAEPLTFGVCALYLCISMIREIHVSAVHAMVQTDTMVTVNVMALLL